MSKLTSLGKLESQGNLSSQTKVNLKENESTITLRSGKELLETGRETRPRHGQKTESEKDLSVQNKNSEQSAEPKADQRAPLVFRPLFPERLEKSKKEKEEKEILDMFHK